MLINKHIKKGIVYTFLFVYSSGVLKPLMPLVNDVIAHTFYKMEHLATVHFQNGKYHVHMEQAMEANGQKNDAKGTIPLSAYETLANHLTKKTEELKIYSAAQIAITFFETPPLFMGFINTSTLPPEV